MSDPESVESLVLIRSYITTMVQGLNFIPDLSVDQKIMAVREAVHQQGHSWDPGEWVLWSEMIHHVESGLDLTDEYLLDWRHRYRGLLGLD